MSATCPHCTKELGSGYLTQDQLTERLKGPAKSRDDALAAAAKAADDLAAMQATTAAQLKIANEKVDASSAAATKALADAQKAAAERDRFQSLAADGITKPAKVKGFSLAYDAYAAEAGDKAKPFADWLAADARSDEFLAQHFVKPAEVAPPATDAAAPPPAAPPAAEAAKPPPAAKALPPANAGAGSPPSGTGKLTQAQATEAYSRGVDEIIAKKLPKADRDREIAALKQTTAAQVA